MSDIKKLKEKASKRGIGPSPDGGYERHVLVCVGGSCSAESENKATLRVFRKRAKVLQTQGHSVYCTPVECLQFCKGGPLVVVYPEGTWYHSVSPSVAEQIAESHLKNGIPVDDHVITANPLWTVPTK